MRGLRNLFYSFKNFSVHHIDWNPTLTRLGDILSALTVCNYLSNIRRNAMNENNKPIDAIANAIKSAFKPSFNRPDLGFPIDLNLEDLSDLELRTLKDDPAFTELLVSFKEEIVSNRKSSTRAFIIALLSLIIGSFSLAWSIFSVIFL